MPDILDTPDNQLPSPDHVFTTPELSTIAGAVGLSNGETVDVVAQADTSTVAKNRRKALLKLLALLQTTA